MDGEALATTPPRPALPPVVGECARPPAAGVDGWDALPFTAAAADGASSAGVRLGRRRLPASSALTATGSATRNVLRPLAAAPAVNRALPPADPLGDRVGDASPLVGGVAAATAEAAIRIRGLLRVAGSVALAAAGVAGAACNLRVTGGTVAFPAGDAARPRSSTRSEMRVS